MIQALVAEGTLHLLHDHLDLAEPLAVNLDPISGEVSIRACGGNRVARHALDPGMIDAIDLIWTDSPTAIVVHVGPYAILGRKAVALSVNTKACA